jgi:CPA2 family monovalent cation:H+ antiporter-2
MPPDLVLVVVAGFCGGVIARLLRQPLVLGYLLAGVIIGPQVGLFAVSDPRELARLAEIGVTLLLFGLGLELSLKDLAPVRRVALVGTPIQIALTIAVGAALGAWLGLGWRESVWLGALISLSSTLVVLKALQAQGRIGTLSSRVMLGMLVAQDLAFIPLMIVMPRLTSGEVGGAIAVALLKAVIFLALMLLVGVRLIPRLVERVARSGSRELFLLVTMGIALGVGYLTHWFALSEAMGAFAAGVVLSESDYSHQALSDIIPLRDIFSLLFFASVGMLLDPAHLLAHWREAAVIVVVAAVAKGVIFWGTTRAFGYRNVVPLASALAMFQVGEFSFVLAGAGLAAGAISRDLYVLVLNAAVITMVLTPLVSGLTTPIYAAITRRRAREPVQTINVVQSGLENHVIVAGAGRVGSGIARVLRRLDLPFVLIELDHRRIDAARQEGLPIVFGDAAQHAVLRGAGIGRARLLLVTTPDLATARALVEYARQVNPEIDVVVRAEGRTAISALREMGVAEIVQPELEASLEMTRQALLHLRMPALEIIQLTDRLRLENYAPPDQKPPDHGQPADKLH